jgi:general secretion pathway protein D
MQVKKLLLCVALALPLIASAQFDLGGGETTTGGPWKTFKLNPRTRIKLDFKNASPDMIVSLMSKTSGITIVKDPSLKTPLTIGSAKPVSLDDAFQIFSSVLDLAGYNLQKSGSILVIRKKPDKSAQPAFDPTAMAAAMGAAGDQGGGQDRSVLKVYEIKFANATEVARVINDVFAPSSTTGGNNNPFGGGRGGRFGGGATFAFGGGGGGGGGGGRNQQPNVKASADDFSNSVIVNAPDRQQTQVEELIGKIDKQTTEPQQTHVYKLIYASATDIASAVQNVLVSHAPQGKGGATSSNIPFEQRFQQAARLGGSQAAFGTVVADARTNSLVVTATEENLKVVEQVILELDQPVTVQNSVIVIPLQNARADLTAQVINSAFSGRNTGNGNNNNTNPANRNTTNNTGRLNNNNGNRGTTGPSDPNAMQLNMEDPNAQSGPLATTVDVAQGFQIFGGGGGFGGGGRFGQNNNQNQNQTARDSQGRVVNSASPIGQVQVIADPTTNSLIVVGTPENTDMVRQIVDQIDKIPQQVMIETLIVEASLTAQDKLGVEWNFAQQHAFGNNAKGTGAVNFPGQPAQGATGSGFTYTIAGRDFSAFVNALKTDTKFQVLSAPRIFTSNNTQAQINVSQQVPYVLSQQTDTNGNVIFNYAFQDVGIVLTVTPRISANGTVTMDVVQTANDLQGFTSFNAPIVNQREADTTVSVLDGETIVLGGIMRTTVNSTVNKIPLLGDIPLLGNLFRSTTKEKDNTELLVFLTPHIVKNSDDAEKVKKDTTDKLSPGAKKAVDSALGKGNDTGKGTDNKGGN